MALFLLIFSNFYGKEQEITLFFTFCMYLSLDLDGRRTILLLPQRRI